MIPEHIKNYLLIAAAVIIGILGYKVMFEKKFLPMPQVISDHKGGKKAISPYHEYQVKNTVMKKRAAIIGCYDTFLDTKPKRTNGVIKVDFEIDGDGDIIGSDIVTSPFQNKKLHTCITGAIKEWQFPEPNIQAPVYVEHSFTFKKREKAATNDYSKKPLKK